MASSPDPVATFIARWSDTELVERANKNLLIKELCDVLDLLHPAPLTLTARLTTECTDCTEWSHD